MPVSPSSFSPTAGQARSDWLRDNLVLVLSFIGTLGVAARIAVTWAL